MDFGISMIVPISIYSPAVEFTSIPPDTAAGTTSRGWPHLQKKKARSIKARLIFNNSLRNYGKRIRDAWTVVRYFKKQFEPLTETNIQDDRVATIVWSDEPILFLIRDKFVAESYLQYFEEMWKQAKP